MIENHLTAISLISDYISSQLFDIRTLPEQKRSLEMFSTRTCLLRNYAVVVSLHFHLSSDFSLAQVVNHYHERPQQ